jgi:HEAT repeat protein
MFIGPENQAVDVLNNKKLSYHRREVAVHYLAQHPTPEGIKALVVALRDSELAIRWTAATALAQLGPLALPEVLKALVDPKTNTVRLREGVMHILHYSSNLAHEPVYKQSEMEATVHTLSGKLTSANDLLNALKGPAADIKSMKAAGKLLAQMEHELAGKAGTKKL